MDRIIKNNLKKERVAWEGMETLGTLLYSTLPTSMGPRAPIILL